MARPTRDAPRVVVFPPLVPIGAVASAALLERLHPLGWFNLLEPALRLLIGVILLVAGLALVVSGRLALTRGGTNVHPSRPALALIETGIYRWTRNPLYLGGSLAMLASGFLLGLDWGPMLFAISLAILHFGIVLPEEDYLERKFGCRYRQYKARTSRYIGRF